MRSVPAYIKFLFFFLSIYTLLYYGTYAFIGLSTEGGRYIAWLKYIDYVSLYRYILLGTASQVIEWLGYYTQLRGKYLLYVNGTIGIQLMYWCLGIGILSFWISYVFAYSGDTLRFRLKWIIVGIVIITCLNIARIVLLLMTYYHKGVKEGGINHHDLYNYILYGIIFLMMIIHRKMQRKH